MATIKTNLGTSTALTITLASLANGSGRCSTAVDNSSTNAISADIYIKTRLNSSGVSATGYLDVYLVRSEDGTTYEDKDTGSNNYTGTDAAFTPYNCIKIGVISAVTNSDDLYAVVNTELAGVLPRKYAIAIVNNSGAALDSTAGNHAVTYTAKTVQSA